MISGKNIKYTVEDHGKYYKVIASLDLTIDKVIERQDIYSINYDESIIRKSTEEKLDTELFNLIYGDLYMPVRKLRWWVSRNCDNNLLLLDALNRFNEILKLLRLQL